RNKCSISLLNGNRLHSKLEILPFKRRFPSNPTHSIAAAAAHLPNTLLRCGSSAPTQHASPLRQQRTYPTRVSAAAAAHLCKTLQSDVSAERKDLFN
ncbi:MAG: hypothetical protein WCY55_05575, partial [Anaerovoracaceae bacterium]